MVAVLGKSVTGIQFCILSGVAGREPIAFAYLHGSVLTSCVPRDVDVAVFLTSEAHSAFREGEGVEMGFAIPLEMETLLKHPAEVQVLNHAPLNFRHRVVSEGVVVAEKYQAARVDFEYLSRYQYFDFRYLASESSRDTE